MKSIKKVALTGAAGQIVYSLAFRIAQGDLFGPHQPVALHLLDVKEALESLKGLVMELEDCLFPLLHSVKIGHVAEEMFEEIDVAVLIGAKPRGPGMERKDLLKENGAIFVEQGRALNRVASKQAQILVVGNPCNTNCLIALHHAPALSPSQFYAMTRLDHNRAIYQLALKATALPQEISRVTIWGNHSATQVPDFTHVHIRGRPIEEVIPDRNWLETIFVKTIQQRGAAVISARGKSSAASAAQAILHTLQSLVAPTPREDWFSLGLFSTHNPYSIHSDLIFSFPCRSQGAFQYEIVPGLNWDPFIQEQISTTEKELLEERDLITPLLQRSS